MFNIVNTLLRGANARSTEAMREHFSLELIDQKIRETESAQHNAKSTLASLIQRQRSEQKLLQSLDSRIMDLTNRARLALEDGKTDLAEDAAQAIAEMENERSVRAETKDGLDSKSSCMRLSVEKAQRRLVDLKQGAISARAVEQERRAQSSLSGVTHRSSSAREAEDLIQRILGKDCPDEKEEILSELENDLSNRTIAEKLGEAGYGDKSKVSASDVLARLTTS